MTTDKYTHIINETENYIFRTQLEKYCLPGEKSWNDIVKRFEVKLREDNKQGLISEETVNRIIELIKLKKYIPAGSILYGFNNKNKQSSFSNCYYIDIKSDSIEGIFDTLKENARTFSFRGGVGNSLEILRPAASAVNNSAKESSGSVSFMPLFAQTTSTIAQRGRRGALMLSHAIWHPDIENFILSKTNREKVFGKEVDLSNCNISLKISDDFMEAVEKDENWKLIFPDIENDKEKYEKEWNGDIEDWKTKGGKLKEFKKIKARKLLKQIAECSWRSGEPGILFWDNIKKNTPTQFNTITAPRGVNPCLSGDTNVIIAAQNSEGTFEIDLKGLNIKDVKEGMTILSFDERVKCLTLDKVIFAGKTKENQELLELNGVKMTLDHQVYVKEPMGNFKYKKSFRVKEDDKLIGFNLKTQYNKIKLLNTKEDVYDITTRQHHNFFVFTPGKDAFLVHNCGEQILNNYGNCLLGASVLSTYVDNPYELNASFNFTEYEKDIPVIFEFMDYLININHHPLSQQKETDVYSRKIGYELTAIADAIAMLGYTYDSPKSFEFLKNFLRKKLISEFKTEVSLAKRLGCAPALEGKIKEYAKQPYITKILKLLKDYEENETVKDFYDYGVRNIAWSTFGPSGTLSIIAGNVTSGIEPLFRLEYTRRSDLFQGEEFKVIHYPLFKYLLNKNRIDLETSMDVLKEKYNYKEAHEILPEDRITFQSIIQEYTTDSISSTINLPEEATVDDIYRIYILAWKAKLKGITIFRDGCDIEGILNKPKENKNILTKKQIPSEANSRRYIVKTKNSEKVYVNIVQDKDKTPLEIFATLPNEMGIIENKTFSKDDYLENLSNWLSITRLSSLLLRYNIPISEITEQLDRASFSSLFLPSIISKILKKYTDSINYQKCPICNEVSLKIENGCETCVSCGYSKCAL